MNVARCQTIGLARPQPVNMSSLQICLYGSNLLFLFDKLPGCVRITCQQDIQGKLRIGEHPVVEVGELAPALFRKPQLLSVHLAGQADEVASDQIPGGFQVH